MKVDCLAGMKVAMRGMKLEVLLDWMVKSWVDLMDMKMARMLVD